MNIPGTVGGAVKMNANAYGGELARVLEWADVATPAGHRPPRARPSSSFSLPPLQPRPARGRGRASFALEAAAPATVKATLAEMRASPPGGAAVGHQDLRLAPSRTPTTPAPRGAARACCWTRPGAAG